jgi:hypothetical protein
MPDPGSAISNELLNCCRCLEPSSVDEADLADSAPLQFVAGVAQDLQIADERAVSMACNWVAGHCRSRIVEVRAMRDLMPLHLTSYELYLCRMWCCD